MSSKFRAYDRNTRQTAIATSAEDPEQAAYYYVYTGTGTLVPNSKVASPCADLQSNLFPAGTDFTTDHVDRNHRRCKLERPLDAQEGQFRLRYRPCRSRRAFEFSRSGISITALAWPWSKSSISSAFAPLTDKFRIGFVSMNPLNDSTNADSGVATNKYLAIKDFSDSNKASWYSKVYDQVPLASSPAREGLARVGRHYAGKMDGINKDMGPDPVQYSCQQNFTIMTTDGYWNTAAETRGPVGLDGVTKVGNTDGILTAVDKLNRDDPLLYSHRPMWDGAYSGKRTDTNRMQQQRYLACDSGQFYKTTTVMHQTTTQPVKTTQQLTKSTAQISMTTQQVARSTSQTQQTTKTETKQTLQALASTQQTTLSTRQEQRQVSWYGNGSTSTYKTTNQILQTTSYKQKEVTTRRSQTFQTLEVTSRVLKKTTQTQQSTVINRQSTSQRLMTQTTYSLTTTQPTQSTSQLRLKTTRVAERTSQLTAYNAATEQAVPVASCTNTSTITCITLTTGPTFVASCTPQGASAGNNYLARTCDAPVVTGPSPAASCTAAGASSGKQLHHDGMLDGHDGVLPLSRAALHRAPLLRTATRQRRAGRTTLDRRRRPLALPARNSSTNVDDVLRSDHRDGRNWGSNVQQLRVGHRGNNLPHGYNDERRCGFLHRLGTDLYERLGDYDVSDACHYRANRSFVLQPYHRDFGERLENDFVQHRRGRFHRN